MRIGVDATSWPNQRGYGRYTRALLRVLVQRDVNNSYVFFTDSADGLDSLPSRAAIVRVPTTIPASIAASSSSRRSFGDLWRMSRALADPSLDILFFPTVYSYVPVFSRAIKVVMIQDIIADKYQDLTLPSRTARSLWNAKVALGRWQADAIGTLSVYSRDAIIAYFRIRPERVSVIGAAPDPVFRVLDEPEASERLTSLGISGTNPTIVYVGGFGPHKNLEMLVSVFRDIACMDEFKSTRLVMVGENQKEVFHSYFGKIYGQVKALGLQDRVIFTGYLADDELVALLNIANVLVLPSLMEGFGLPAVEAAACGCPVIATKSSPLPQLLGEGGLYIDPFKPNELKSALVSVLSSPALRTQMRQAGLAAAQCLTWDAAAEQAIEVFRKATRR